MVGCCTDQGVVAGRGSGFHELSWKRGEHTVGVRRFTWGQVWPGWSDRGRSSSPARSVTPLPGRESPVWEVGLTQPLHIQTHD